MPGQEIFDVRFSPNSRNVAFVRRVHWPDAGDAVGVPSADLEALRARAAKEPRFQDPEVVVARLGEENPLRIDWGWEPAFSPDGAKIAYARQVNPLTGLRVLAATLKGNEIVVRDLAAAEGTVVAKPSVGAYGEPMFSRDGAFVYFTISDATEGAWPTPVGMGVVDLGTNTVGTLLPRRKKFGQFHLQGPRWQVGDDVLAVRLTPRRDGAYRAELLNVTGGSRRLYAWPRVEDLSALTLGIGADGFAYVKSPKWLRIDRRTGKATRVAKPPFLNRSGGSPDGRFRCLTSERAFRIVDRKGRSVLRCALPGEVMEFAWMPNSRGIAVVSARRTEGRFERDVLEVYRW